MIAIFVIGLHLLAALSWLIIPGQSGVDLINPILAFRVSYGARFGDCDEIVSVTRDLQMLTSACQHHGRYQIAVPCRGAGYLELSEFRTAEANIGTAGTGTISTALTNARFDSEAYCV
jgi:hypothetical protein